MQRLTKGSVLYFLTLVASRFLHCSLGLIGFWIKDILDIFS